MANIAASTKLGLGFGPVNQGSAKIVCVSFATTATGDVLIFDASNVGKENALANIVWAVPVVATNFVGLVSTVIASNQITIGQVPAATFVTILAVGVGA